MIGTLDDEDMLLKASTGQIEKLREIGGGLLFVDYSKSTSKTDMFDYDLQIQAKVSLYQNGLNIWFKPDLFQVSATVAKLIRFFEAFAVGHIEIKNHDAFQTPVDHAVAVPILSNVKKIEDGSKLVVLYEADCPLDIKKKVKFKYQGDLNQDGSFRNQGVFSMFSDFKVKDLMLPTAENATTANNTTDTDNDPNANEVTEEDIRDYRESYLSIDQIPSLEDPKRIISMRINFTDDGKANGFVTVTFVDGTALEGFAKDNVLHGIARRLDYPQHQNSVKR